MRCFLDPRRANSPTPPSAPLTPPPTPAKRDPSPGGAVDVNENDETLVSVPVKRVTFAIDESPEVSSQVFTFEPVCDSGDSIAEEELVLPVDGEVNCIVDARVTITELIVSHCAFFLIFLMAVAVNYLSC